MGNYDFILGAGAGVATYKATKAWQNPVTRAEIQYTMRKTLGKTIGRSIDAIGTGVDRLNIMANAPMSHPVNIEVFAAARNTNHILKNIGKFAKPLAVGIAAYDIYDAYNKEGSKGAKKQVVKSGASLAGAWAGTKVGIGIGGVIGSIICPGVGTTVGIVIGSFLGGIGGWIAGDKLARAIVD